MLAQQFLVNQTVEGTAAVLVGQLIERATFYERFETDGIVPIALQNDMAVDGGDDAVNHVGGASRSGQRQQQENACEMGEDTHQNACPMLKKKLK